MKIVGILLAAVLALTLAGPAQAQFGKTIGVGALAAFPTDDNFSDVYNTGFGAAIFSRKGVAPIVSVTGQIGYTRFGAKSELNLSDVSVFEFTAGGLANLGMFNGGVEFGYFTDVDDWSFVPNIGVKIAILDASLRYKAGGVSWLAFRLGASL